MAKIWFFFFFFFLDTKFYKKKKKKKRKEKKRKFLLLLPQHAPTKGLLGACPTTVHCSRHSQEWTPIETFQRALGEQ